jgi:hypothetical protein
MRRSVKVSAQSFTFHGIKDVDITTPSSFLRLMKLRQPRHFGGAVVAWRPLSRIVVDKGRYHALMGGRKEELPGDQA